MEASSSTNHDESVVFLDNRTTFSSSIQKTEGVRSSLPSRGENEEKTFTEKDSMYKSTDDSQFRYLTVLGQSQASVSQSLT